MDVKLSFQPISKSGIKWPVIQVGSSTKWCSTGVCFGTSFIPDLIQANVRMFTDDTKIYSVIKSFHDNFMLQKDLDNLMQWSRTWL